MREVSTFQILLTMSPEAISIAHLLLSSYGNRLDLIGGYQYAEIDHSVARFPQPLFITILGRFPSVQNMDSNDLFDVENKFHGGNVGLMSESERTCYLAVSAGESGVWQHAGTGFHPQRQTTSPNGAVARKRGRGLVCSANQYWSLRKESICRDAGSRRGGRHQTDESAPGYRWLFDVVLVSLATGGKHHRSNGEYLAVWRRRVIGEARPAFSVR